MKLTDAQALNKKRIIIEETNIDKPFTKNGECWWRHGQ